MEGVGASSTDDDAQNGLGELNASADASARSDLTPEIKAWLWDGTLGWPEHLRDDLTSSLRVIPDLDMARDYHALITNGLHLVVALDRVDPKKLKVDAFSQDLAEHERASAASTQVVDARRYLIEAEEGRKQAYEVSIAYAQAIAKAREDKNQQQYADFTTKLDLMSDADQRVLEQELDRVGQDKKNTARQVAAASVEGRRDTDAESRLMSLDSEELALKLQLSFAKDRADLADQFHRIGQLEVEVGRGVESFWQLVTRQVHEASELRERRRRRRLQLRRARDVAYLVVSVCVGITVDQLLGLTPFFSVLSGIVAVFVLAALEKWVVMPYFERRSYQAQLEGLKQDVIVSARTLAQIRLHQAASAISGRHYGVEDVAFLPERLTTMQTDGPSKGSRQPK